MVQTKLQQSDGSTETEEKSNEEVSVCKEIWEKSSKSPTLLLTMCIGASDDPNYPNFDEEPYSSMKQKRKTLPTTGSMQDEINRRWMASMTGKKPHPQHWSKKQCTVWLSANNSALTTADRTFLIESELRFRETISAAVEEVTAVKKIRDENDVWRGQNPWLRLYTVLIHDKVLPLFRYVIYSIHIIFILNDI